MTVSAWFNDVSRNEYSDIRGCFWWLSSLICVWDYIVTFNSIFRDWDSNQGDDVVICVWKWGIVVPYYIPFDSLWIRNMPVYSSLYHCFRRSIPYAPWICMVHLHIYIYVFMHIYIYIYSSIWVICKKQIYGICL